MYPRTSGINVGYLHNRRARAQVVPYTTNSLLF